MYYPDQVSFERKIVNFLHGAYNCNSLQSSRKFDSRKNLPQSVAGINRCENSGDNFEKLRECYFKNNQYGNNLIFFPCIYLTFQFGYCRVKLNYFYFNHTNFHFALRSTRTTCIFYVQSKIFLLVNIVAPGKIDYDANPFRHKYFETQHTQTLFPYGRVCQDLQWKFFTHRPDLFPSCSIVIKFGLRYYIFKGCVSQE